MYASHFQRNAHEPKVHSLVVSRPSPCQHVPRVPGGLIYNSLCVRSHSCCHVLAMCAISHVSRDGQMESMIDARSMQLLHLHIFLQVTACSTPQHSSTAALCWHHPNLRPRGSPQGTLSTLQAMQREYTPASRRQKATVSSQSAADRTAL